MVARLGGEGMTSLATGHRYTVEQASYGWDVIDTETGESRGICPTEHEAQKSAQQLNALFLANTMRLAAAEFKRELSRLDRHAGACRLASVLSDDCDGPLGALQIQAALRALRGIGSEKASRIARWADVTVASRRIRDLTPRQRAVIANALETYW
jgi:hypothetical protein